MVVVVVVVLATNKELGFNGKSFFFKRSEGSEGSEGGGGEGKVKQIKQIKQGVYFFSTI